MEGEVFFGTVLALPLKWLNVSSIIMCVFNLKSILILLFIKNVVNGVSVKVRQGTLEGEVLDLITGDGSYYSFKGIRYAQPPVGKLRFKAPLPALPWKGVRNATQHGPVCPKFNVLTNTYIPGSEDCLFLNVYSPNLEPETGLLPVLVFIHGGGYKIGDGNVDFFGPDFLVKKNVVVVTLNYRLDALGFLTMGTKEVPGNAGMKDQVMALKWVRRNIKSFGGDRDRVTIMGQSAGSSAVALHVSSPMSKGLFQRAIAMSGTPHSDWSLPFHPERRAFVLGKQLGFETRDPEQLLEFLQNVPIEKLVNTAPNVLSYEEYSNNLIRMYQFIPVVEKFCGPEHFLSYDLFKKVDYVNKVDILFGFTSEELIEILGDITSTFIKQYNKYPELLVPRKILTQVPSDLILDLSDEIRDYYFGNKSIDDNTTKEFINYANNLVFKYDVSTYFASLPIVKGTSRYFYQFSCMSKLNVNDRFGEQYGIRGASHTDHLNYLFYPNIFNQKWDPNSLEAKLIEQSTTLFTNFVKYGNPTPDTSLNFTWPQFDKNIMNYVDITNDINTKTVYNFIEDDNFRFWKSIYSKMSRCLN